MIPDELLAKVANALRREDWMNFDAEFAAQVALEAAGVEEMVAERRYLQELSESHRRTAERLTPENLVLEGWTAEARAALTEIVTSHDVAMPIEMDERIRAILNPKKQNENT